MLVIILPYHVQNERSLSTEVVSLTSKAGELQQQGIDWCKLSCRPSSWHQSESAK